MYLGVINKQWRDGLYLALHFIPVYVAVSGIKVVFIKYFDKVINKGKMNTWL